MKETKKRIFLAAGAFLAFALWTALVCLVDVRAIGPRGSSVGLATLNGAVHALFGVHFSLYIITDLLGLVPVAVGFGFAILGLFQWIRRRSLFRVDRSLFVLGAFYIVMLAAYLLFEAVPINYRPVLISGFLEVSYPSSTTLLVLCVMPTAEMQLSSRIKSTTLRRCVSIGIYVFTAFMVIARLVSGVHWCSDIVGGILLSAGLVMLYRALAHPII